MSYSVKSIRKKFAAEGVFYTDNKLAEILKQTVERYVPDIKEVYDPTCGAGNLLTVFPDSVCKWGQELNPEQADAARRNLTNATIAEGDTLKSPAFSNSRFRHIVANYPFSVKWEPLEDERWQGAPCLPPPSKADYAFIMHILSMMADDGVAAVLAFPGVLYRGQREGKIRQWLVEQNLIEEIAHIPGEFFEDTNIIPALIVFRKGRDRRTVTFRDEERKLSREVSLEEIADNGYNLSINTYLTKEEPPKIVDPVALECKARSEIIHKLKNQLEFSAHAIMVHDMLGLPPLPPMSEFVADIINTITPFLHNPDSLGTCSGPDSKSIFSR